MYSIVLSSPLSGNGNNVYSGDIRASRVCYVVVARDMFDVRTSIVRLLFALCKPSDVASEKWGFLAKAAFERLLVNKYYSETTCTLSSAREFFDTTNLLMLLPRTDTDTIETSNKVDNSYSLS